MSLATKPESPELVGRFFDKMHSTAGEGQDMLLLDLPGWLTHARWHGFFRRYREDIWGFVLAWGAVGLMVLAAWGLVQLGK